MNLTIMTISDALIGSLTSLLKLKLLLFFSLQKSSSFRFSKRSPKRMDRLRRSFRDSFRRRKDRVPESSKPHQWQSDTEAVHSATCSFPVKYLGCVEVFESRGMHICEEALKVLRVNILIFVCYSMRQRNVLY